MLREPVGLLVDEALHAFDRHARVPPECEEPPDAPRQTRERVEVGGEEHEVTDGELASAHRGGGEEQHDADRNFHGGDVERVQRFPTHVIPNRGGVAAPVVLTQAPDDSLLGAGGLHRQRRREELAEVRRRRGGCLPIRTPEAAHARREDAIADQHCDQRQDRDQGDQRVDLRHHRQREDGEHEPAGDVEVDVDEPHDVLDVVAEPGDRLARRPREALRSGARVEQRAGEHVRPEQRAHPFPHAEPRHPRAEEDRPPRRFEPGEDRDEAVGIEPGGFGAGQRVEDRTERDPDEERHGVERDPRQRSHGGETRSDPPEPPAHPPELHDALPRRPSSTSAAKCDDGSAISSTRGPCSATRP